MAKTKAPLLSFDASGQIANTQVYAKWRGISYVRRYVTPENPRTAPQQLTRNIFRTMGQMWLHAPALLKAPWSRYAAGRPFLDRNAFMGQNIKALRGDADMAGLIGSPGASGGIPPNSIAVAAGIGSLTVTFNNPAGPAGWVLESAVAIATPNQAPDADFSGEIVAAEDAAAPNDTVVLGGLTPGQAYVVSGWLRWTKDGGRTAFSPSTNAVAVAG